MAHPTGLDRPHAERPAWVTAASRWGLNVGFLGLLGLVVLNSATGGPDQLVAWHVTTAFLLFAGALIVGRYAYAMSTDGVPKPYLIDYQLVLLVGLLGIAYQSRNPGFGLGIHRPLETLAVFAALVAFCVLAGDPRRYSVIQWLVIACFATVVGIFFYHSLDVAEISVRSRHPVWAGFIMGVALVVLPQYISRHQFLWALNRLAAIVVLLALPVYVLGEYSLYGLQFTFHDAYTVPIVEYEVQATRSLFVNRNAFAIVVFAGLIAAVAELHRTIVDDRSIPWVIAPSVLLAINAVGLAIAYGRALWVITPMVIGVYLAAVVDRRLIPVAIVGAFAYLLAGIYAIHSGLITLPENTPTRAPRWYPSIEAILDQPSLLGAGLVDPGQVISEYHPTGSAGSPHNSYLSIAIRTGIVGGLAYGGLMALSLLRGMARYRAVDLGVLALAIGFAAHQIFEAYTLFGWWSSSILAALSIGFLAFGRMGRDQQDLTVTNMEARNADQDDALRVAE